MKRIRKDLILPVLYGVRDDLPKVVHLPAVVYSITICEKPAYVTYPEGYEEL